MTFRQNYSESSVYSIMTSIMTVSAETVHNLLLPSKITSAKNDFLLKPYAEIESGKQSQQEAIYHAQQLQQEAREVFDVFRQSRWKPSMTDCFGRRTGRRVYTL